MPDSKTMACRRCLAQVLIDDLPDHYLWHARAEPSLNEPTSTYGWWDETGRWVPTDRP